MLPSVKIRKDSKPTDPITEAERSGSITGIGIVLGFSLGFVSQWSLTPGQWRYGQLLALGVVVLGIYAELYALLGVLRLPLVTMGFHRRLINTFLTGFSLVWIGFGIHIVVELP